MSETTNPPHNTGGPMSETNPEPNGPAELPPGSDHYDAVPPLDLDNSEDGPPRMLSAITDRVVISPQQWEQARLNDWGTFIPVGHMDDNGWENDVLKLSLANVVIQYRPLVELGDDRGWVCKLAGFASVEGEDLPL
jgi:hypothetical protein